MTNKNMLARLREAKAAADVARTRADALASSLHHEVAAALDAGVAVKNVVDVLEVSRSRVYAMRDQARGTAQARRRQG